MCFRIWKRLRKVEEKLKDIEREEEIKECEENKNLINLGGDNFLQFFEWAKGEKYCINVTVFSDRGIDLDLLRDLPRRISIDLSKNAAKKLMKQMQKKGVK